MRKIGFSIDENTNNLVLVLYGMLLGVGTSILVSVVDLCIDRIFGLTYQPVSYSDPELRAFFTGAILFAPFFETLIFQLASIEFFIRFFGKKRFLIVSLSAIIFSLAHFNPGLSHSIRMIFVGLALAIIYYRTRDFSLKNAFVITFATHTFHNAIIIALFFLSEKGL